VFLVAAAPERLAGFLIGTVESSIPIYRIKEFGFIHDLWWKRTIGTKASAANWRSRPSSVFAALGVAQIRLDTAAANDPARALFASCGFRPSATEMLLELPRSIDPGRTDEGSEI